MDTSDIVDILNAAPTGVLQNLSQVLGRFSNIVTDKLFLGSELKTVERKHATELKNRVASIIVDKFPSYLDENPQLVERTLEYYVSDVLRAQKNREKIVKQSFSHISPSNSATEQNKISDDWLTQFFQYAGDISDEKMQTIWAKLLANEIQQAGSFHRKTLQIVRLLEQEEAEHFTNLCSVSCSTPNGIGHIYFGLEEDYFLERIGLNIDILHDLSVLGVLPQVLDCRILISEPYKIKYFDKTVILSPPKEESQNLYLSILSFSKYGEQLHKISGARYCEDYYLKLLDSFSQSGFNVHMQ